MKLKKTISILATMALGIAAAQAGRGTTLIVPSAASQVQHANSGNHTFALGEMYSYKINSVSYSLKTIDASSPGNKILLSNNGSLLAELSVPLVRKQVEEGTIVFDPPLQLSGDINLLFDFTHTASAFGAVALNVEYQQNAPEASGNLVAPTYANTEDKPKLDWSALISVKTETSVTDVTGAAAGAEVDAPNAGTTETTDTSPGSSGSAPGQNK